MFIIWVFENLYCISESVGDKTILRAVTFPRKKSQSPKALTSCFKPSEAREKGSDGKWIRHGNQQQGNVNNPIICCPQKTGFKFQTQIG